MNRFSVKVITALAVLLLTACQTAGGDGVRSASVQGAAKDTTVVENVTAEQLKRYFTDEGFTSVEIDSDGDVIARMNGYRVAAILQENDFPAIRYYFAIAGTEATISDVDEWNRLRYFTKAYLDNEGDPVLEMVVNLEGGVTIANLRSSIRTFSQAHTAFLREIAA